MEVGQDDGGLDDLDLVPDPETDHASADHGCVISGQC